MLFWKELSCPESIFLQDGHNDENGQQSFPHQLFFIAHGSWSRIYWDYNLGNGPFFFPGSHSFFLLPLFNVLYFHDHLQCWTKAEQIVPHIANVDRHRKIMETGVGRRTRSWASGRSRNVRKATWCLAMTTGPRIFPWKGLCIHFRATAAALTLWERKGKVIPGFLCPKPFLPSLYM